jgi:hypothetical protein
MKIFFVRFIIPDFIGLLNKLASQINFSLYHLAASSYFTN